MLLEIVLNAGSVALEGAATSSGGVLSCGDRTPPCCAVRSAWIGEALADHIVSYRIAIFCLISYRIYRFLLKLYHAITRWQHKTELDGDKWSVGYASLEVTRRKSTQVNMHMVANSVYVVIEKNEKIFTQENCNTQCHDQKNGYYNKYH